MQVINFFMPTPGIDWFLEKENLDWQDIAKAMGSYSGNFTSWILTTYVRLRQCGIPCNVVKTMPQQGIVIADRDSLGNQYPYLGDVMLICAKGDREFHSSAHIHIVQNQTEEYSFKDSSWRPYFIPMWPQPDLKPRDSNRLQKIENIRFYGSRSNIARELLSDDWKQQIEALDCRWETRYSPQEWNDYQDTDLVVAIRSFEHFSHAHKPASKLVNCWLAGVPVILPPESAFMALKTSPLDFVEVGSPGEVISAIKDLKKNPQKYQSIIANGFYRSQEYTEDKILGDWIRFIEEYVYPQYRKFQNELPIGRRFEYFNRVRKLKLSRLVRRFR